MPIEEALAGISRTRRSRGAPAAVRAAAPNRRRAERPSPFELDPPEEGRSCSARQRPSLPRRRPSKRDAGTAI